MVRARPCKNIIPAILLLLAGGCTFSPAFDAGDYPACGTDGQCREGCVCLDGKVCVPTQAQLGPRACAECLADSDCRHGCLCRDFACRPPLPTQYGDYCLTGPQCDEDNPCQHGCRCDDFQCLPPEQTDYPDYCTLGPPECDDHHPCAYDKCECVDFHCQPDVDTTYPGYCTYGPPECDDHHPCTYDKCECVDFHCQPDIATSYPDYCTYGPPECEHDRQCVFGCHCDNFICQPRVDFGSRDCHSSTIACSAEGDCRLGCICTNGTCQPLDGHGLDPSYCGYDLSPTCMDANLVVTTGEDVVDDADGVLSLREAILIARQTNTTNHIGFAVPEVTVSDGPLPALPSFTYLDGGEGVRLQAGDVSGAGITIDGDAIAVSGLVIVGFDIGVKVNAGSRDIHMFRLRVGEPGSGNESGIVIDNASRVFIGRGRELECVERNRIPLPPGGLDDPSALFKNEYDINVVVANGGDGIAATGVDELYIYGTWVGFDNSADGGYGDLRWGNDGIGINLTNVTNAVIGAQRLEPQELALQYDPLPAFVGVGRNRGGGVAITGGGAIAMPGLILGDTPNMNPYGENSGFNLKVLGNEVPVFYGPHPLADGPEARFYGLVYSEHAIPIQLVENHDLVWIRGVQNECFANMHGCYTTGLKIQNPQAPIKLHHATFIGDFQLSPIFLEGSGGGNYFFEAKNSLFFRESWLDQAIVYAQGELGAAVILDSNMGYLYGAWCDGVCQNPGGASNFMVDPPFDCNSAQAVPLSPACPNVDAGTEIWVTDEAGNTRPMNLTGIPGIPHYGCAPDIGAFECVSADCQNVSCD